MLVGECQGGSTGGFGFACVLELDLSCSRARASANVTGEICMVVDGSTMAVSDSVSSASGCSTPASASSSSSSFVSHR